MMKMKLNKKIAGAAAMLLLSTTMLGTSTFAWFSMNKTVTVTGMELTAKADGTYLIIGPESSAAALQNENRTAYTYDTNDPAELRVYPSAHTASVTNTSTCTVANWYYKYAEAPTASAAAANENPRSIDSAKFETDYVLHKTIYVTLAKGSEAATNLRCTNATFNAAGDTNATGANPTHDAVRVLVTSATAIDEVGAAGSPTLGNTTLAATVNDTTAIPLDLWIYYDGNDASVYTNNAANLDGAVIELEFAVDYATP